MGLVTVKTFDVLSDAEIARARLSADGIPSVIQADNGGGLNPGFYRSYGVRIEVDEADLSDALDSLGVERITIPRPVAQAIAVHGEAMAPHEGCGLVLVDDEGAVVFAVCLTNADASPLRFTIDPSEHHGTIRFAERNGWSVGGVFHSHVRSSPYYSRLRRERAPTDRSTARRRLADGSDSRPARAPNPTLAARLGELDSSDAIY